MNTIRRQRIHWITTGLAALAFLAPGIGNLAHVAHIVDDMARLGYPSYFLTILGTWKILGAIVIIVPGIPRVKEWAYAGMMFDLTGAALSRAATGDPLPLILGPLVVAGIVVASWALRPQRDGISSSATGALAAATAARPTARG
jgi:uncharacterized membrane protein YphA (DoxX/SURF4 family)